MNSVIMPCCRRVLSHDNFQEFLPKEDMVEPLKKGTKDNPFFYMRFTLKKGILRLDPYPVLDEKGTLGPRAQIKDLWPSISGTGVSKEIPMSYLYLPDLRGPFMEYKLCDIIALAVELEEKFYPRSRWDPMFTLNAYRLHPPTMYPFAIIDAMDRERSRDRFVVLPVQFFHVDVERE